MLITATLPQSEGSHFHNRSSSNKLINKTRGQRVYNRHAYRIFQPLCSYQLDCLMCCITADVKPASERQEKKWQLCCCVLLLLFQTSDKCQPLHWLAFCWSEGTARFSLLLISHFKQRLLFWNFSYFGGLNVIWQYCFFYLFLNHIKKWSDACVVAAG